jgi:uncharacterized caspase-like protein
MALAGLLVVSLGCRREQSSDTGGMSDTTPSVSTAAPAPEAEDASGGLREFGFDQRQEFAQSIRQQLAGIDQEISGLAAQAKSRGGAVSDRALANIRTARRTVDRNLTQIEAATAANWEQVKDRVDGSVASLSEAIEAAQPK